MQRSHGYKNNFKIRYIIFSKDLVYHLKIKHLFVEIISWNLAPLNFLFVQPASEMQILFLFRLCKFSIMSRDWYSCLEPVLNRGYIGLLEDKGSSHFLLWGSNPYPIDLVNITYIVDMSYFIIWNESIWFEWGRSLDSHHIPKTCNLECFCHSHQALDWLQSLKQFSSMCHIIYL